MLLIGDEEMPLNWQNDILLNNSSVCFTKKALERELVFETEIF